MAITITKQPTCKAAFANDTVTFTVEATGDGLTYQWQFSQDSGGSWSKLYWDGATTDTMTFAANETRAANLYRCMITDALGNVVYTIAVTLTMLDVASANGLVSSETLKSMANAIRAKTATTDKIFPADMAAMIAGLSVGSEVLTGTFTPSSDGVYTHYLGSSLPAYENHRLIIYGTTSYAVHEMLNGTIRDIASAAARYETINRDGSYWDIDNATGSITYRTKEGNISTAFIFGIGVTYEWCYFELKGASA